MASDDDFESLYRTYCLRLIRFFMRAFHLSQEDAEDCAHETFVRVWRAIHMYRGDAKWAFLETTARHTAYNRFRTKKTRKRDGIEEAIDDAPGKALKAPDGPDPAELPDRAMQVRQLRDAIKELPGVQREYLQMQLSGFSYKEIATFFRTNEGAVKSRLRDARSNLKKKLGAAADLLPGGEE
jgi:RNA polymerase sigma-70 factor (ECF subfamily)